MNNSDYNKLMDEYYTEITKEQEKQSKLDKEVLNKVKEISSKKFYRDLKRFLEDEENGITGYFKIVDEPLGEYQKEDYGSIKGLWVDQYTSPVVCDDYSGYLTVKLENGKYLQCSFSL